MAEQETVRATLRSAWKACSERIESLRQERQKAHSEWLDRMTTHLSRWETQVLKNQATAVQIQGEVADLESQSASLTDDGRASKLRQWINGKRLRLADLEASIKDLGQKIHTVRAKMGKEAPPPITELSEEDLAAASRPSPSPSPGRRSGPARESRGASRGPGRGPTRGPRDERPSDPPSHPGLNLGELLAQHLGLAVGGRAAEIKPEESQIALTSNGNGDAQAEHASAEEKKPELDLAAVPEAGEPESSEPGREGTEAEG
jgi:cell division protein FtsL